jgi:hypothetical protein
MKKRGELSFNAIIIAALGLVVLIVLVMIFTGKMNLFSRSTECAAQNGQCMDNDPQNGCPSDKPISIMTQDCKLVKERKEVNEVPGQCCIPMG